MRHLPPSLPKKLIQPALLPALIATLMAPTVQAAETITDAFKEGKTNVSFRLRYEDVTDDGAPDSANALTLKSRITYQTAEFKNFSLLAEMDDVTALDDVEYNDGVNGMSTKTLIVDPEGTELNQTYLAFTGIPDTTIKAGRQRILLDNQRFVGGVGFRQNEQTYEGLTVTNTSIPDTTLFAGYVTEVLGIKGGDSEAHKTTLLNASYKGLSAGTITGYVYNFEQDETGGYDIDTYGLRFSGSTSGDTKFLYTAEFAAQDQNNGSEPDYYNLEGGIAVSGVTAKLGIEVLGEDNGAGFNTPLATKHKFQGWADIFLATPAAGIEDTYLSLGTTVSGVKLLAVYHDYESDAGSTDLGDELGLLVAKNFDNYGLSLKYASYDASAASGKSDKDKLWLTATAKF